MNKNLILKRDFVGSATKTSINDLESMCVETRKNIDQHLRELGL